MTSPRAVAAKAGDMRYTGKPCKKCGCTEKYTSTATCVDCAKKAAIENTKKIRQHIQEAREIV